MLRQCFINAMFGIKSPPELHKPCPILRASRKVPVLAVRILNEQRSLPLEFQVIPLCLTGITSNMFCMSSDSDCDRDTLDIFSLLVRNHTLPFPVVPTRTRS